MPLCRWVCIYRRFDKSSYLYLHDQIFTIFDWSNAGEGTLISGTDLLTVTYRNNEISSKKSYAKLPSRGDKNLFIVLETYTIKNAIQL